MSVLSLAFSFLLFQTGPLTTIGGRVVDSVANVPIPGARVILVRGPGYSSRDLETKPSTEQDPKASRLAVLTDENGRFRFRVEAPVDCHLFVDAADYVSPWRGVGPENEFKATETVERDDIVVRLARERAISGRVIDYDTGEPLSELTVRAYQYRASGPGRMLMPAGESGRTNVKGEFKTSKLGPGEYYLQIGPMSGNKLTADPKPVEDFRRAVNKSYGQSWYPGVAREEEAVPVRLAAGGDLEGVEIRLAKRRTASIRGRVLSEHATGRTAALILGSSTHKVTGGSYNIVATGEVKEGSEFQIDGLNAGSYWLSARADRLWANRTVQIGEENQDGLDLYLSKGVTVQGWVRIEGRQAKPEEPALIGDPMRIGLSPLVRVNYAQDQPVLVDSRTGTFTMEGVYPERYLVGLRPLPAGYALFEVKYNGTPCRNRLLEMDAASKEHRIDIALAPADSAMLLMVMDGNDPAAKATVLLAPEPITQEAILSFSFQSAMTSDSGAATITGLLPGTYRLIAFREGTRWGDDPELHAKLTNGQQVILGSKEMQRARIEVLR